VGLARGLEPIHAACHEMKSIGSGMMPAQKAKKSEKARKGK